MGQNRMGWEESNVRESEEQEEKKRVREHRLGKSTALPVSVNGTIIHWSITPK